MVEGFSRPKKFESHRPALSRAVQAAILGAGVLAAQPAKAEEITTSVNPITLAKLDTGEKPLEQSAEGEALKFVKKYPILRENLTAREALNILEEMQRISDKFGSKPESGRIHPPYAGVHRSHNGDVTQNKFGLSIGQQSFEFSTSSQHGVKGPGYTDVLPGYDLSLRQTSHEFTLPFGVLENTRGASITSLQARTQSGDYVRTVSVPAEPLLKALYGNEDHLPSALPGIQFKFKDMHLMVLSHSLTRPFYNDGKNMKPAVNGFSGALATTLNKDGQIVPLCQFIGYAKVNIADKEFTIGLCYNRDVLLKAAKAFSQTQR